MIAPGVGRTEYLALRHQNQVESRQLREKAAVLEAEHNNMAQAVKETQIKAAEEIAVCTSPPPTLTPTHVCPLRLVPNMQCWCLTFSKSGNKPTWRAIT